MHKTLHLALLLVVFAAIIGAAPLAAPPDPAAAPSGQGAEKPNPDLDLSLEEDVEHMQVVIEALVIEVNRDRTRDLGINYAAEKEPGGNVLKGLKANFPVSLVTADVPAFEGGSHPNRFLGLGAELAGIDLGNYGQLTANLRMLMDAGAAYIRTRPMAVTLHGEKVTIETVDEIPFQDVEYDKYGRQQLRVKFERVGVRLQVTPYILETRPRENQRIELSLDNVEVSGVSNFVNISQVNRPVFVTSTARTRVILHNGETLVIGGLRSKREVLNESRIPVLGRIPLLGWLFKSEHYEVKDTDVLFYITPHILRPGERLSLPFDFKNRPELDVEPAGDPELSPFE